MNTVYLRDDAVPVVPYGGEWVSGAAIKKGEFRSLNGILYMAKLAHTASASTMPNGDPNTIYAKAFLGEYVATDTYQKYEGVSYNGSSFFSRIDDNIGHTPPSDGTSNAYWYCYVKKGDQGAQGIRGIQGLPGTPVGDIAWQGAWSSLTTYSSGQGVTSSGHGYVSIQDDNLNHAVSDATWWVEVGSNGLEYVTDAIEIDHADASPVSLGSAPANSIVEPIIRCTENESGCVLTIGDEDDADSICTDGLIPVDTANAPILGPLGKQYYSDATALTATITTPGTAGKWSIQFRVILVS